MDRFETVLNAINLRVMDLQPNQEAVSGTTLPATLLQTLPQMVEEKGSLLVVPPGSQNEGKERANFEPRKPYFRAVKGYVLGSEKTGGVCRTCCRAIFNTNYIKLHDHINKKDTEILRYMLNELVPDLDLEIYSEPIICTKCLVSLFGSFDFLKMCIKTEEKFRTWLSDRKNVNSRNVTLFVLLDSSTDNDVNTREEVQDDDTLSHASVDLDVEEKIEIEEKPIKIEEDDNTQSILLNLLTKGKVEKVPKDIDLNHGCTSNANVRKKFSYDLKLDAKKVKMRKPRKKPSRRVRILCEICGYVAKSERTYGCHMLSHTEGGDGVIKKCPRCRYVIDDPLLLKKHIDQKHAKRSYLCTQCGKVYTCPTSLRKHINKVHLGISHLHQCHFCGKKIETLVALRQHLLFQHNDENVKYNYKCEKCDKKFVLTALYTNHLKTHEEPSLKCEFCGALIKNQYNLERHLKINHHQTGKHRCKVCKRCFWHQSDLARHEIKDHNGNESTCQFCGIQSSSPAFLKKHISRWHTERTFKCEKCVKSYPCWISLKDHLKRIHGLKGNFQCEVCDLWFWRENGLKKHQEQKHKNVTIIN